MANKVKHSLSFCLLLTGALLQVYKFHQMRDNKSDIFRRILSINLGNGKCKWTAGVPLGEGVESFGTLLASYPGSGMRVTWQHTSALSGLEVGDDFGFIPPDAAKRTGILKTQYPHLEGIWSYGDKMDQVIMLIRNPRWAIPSYHSILYEIHYAHDFETAYKYYNRVFTMRPPVATWIKWRDYTFHEEIELWGWFIDYWMEGGLQYWADLDFERNGQWPFEFLADEEKKIDAHCIYEMECFPTAVVSYERLIDPSKGSDEANKIAVALEGKLAMNVIDAEARPCVWNATMSYQPNKAVANNNRESNSTQSRLDYVFTYKQMLEIEHKLEEYKQKYSTGKWVSVAFAQEIVSFIDEYLIDVHDEIQDMEVNAVPTAAPNEGYLEELLDWYNSIGKGNRYDKAKVQSMAVYPQFAPLYDESGNMIYTGFNEVYNKKYMSHEREKSLDNQTSV